MIKDLNNDKVACRVFDIETSDVFFEPCFSDKVVCGVFDIETGVVKSIDIPDDSVGVKILSGCDILVNVNDEPETPADNELKKGAFVVSGIMETRILQAGQKRVLKLLGISDGTAKVEFWG